MSNPAVESARERLCKFKGRFPEICNRSGLGYSWLSKFSRGVRGERPSFELISTLLHTLDELEAEQKHTPNSAAQ